MTEHMTFDREAFFKDLRECCQRIEPVGSRITCDPIPPDSDEDFLVLTSQLMAILHVFDSHGFDQDGSRIDGGDFKSYSRGDLNIITTTDDVFFQNFMAASSVAKRLNLLDKADRIALFRAVLYAEEC